MGAATFPLEIPPGGITNGAHGRKTMAQRPSSHTAGGKHFIRGKLDCSRGSCTPLPRTSNQIALYSITRCTVSYCLVLYHIAERLVCRIMLQYRIELRVIASLLSLSDFRPASVLFVCVCLCVFFFFYSILRGCRQGKF